MPAFSGRRFARGDGRKPWTRYPASVGTAGGHEQVFDAPPVIAQDAALAYAEPPAVGDDDAARFERFGSLVDGLTAARHAEVRVARRELFDQPIDPALESAPSDRRPHGGGR